MVLVNFCYHLGPKLLISVLPGIFCMPLVLAFYIHRSRQRTSRQYSINGQLVSICRGLWDVRILIPGAFAQTLALSMLLPVLFPYLKTHYGMTQSAYGMLTILGGAVAVLLMVPVGKMVDRWGYRFLLTAGFGLAGIAILVIIHYQYHLLIYPYAVLLGIAYALILPSWNGLIAQLLPEAVRASLYSVMMSIEGLGVAIGPVLGGKLGITYGSRVLFSTSALILIVMACFYFMLHKPVPDSHVDNL
jgi:MFS family permease